MEGTGWDSGLDRSHSWVGIFIAGAFSAFPAVVLFQVGFFWFWLATHHPMVVPEIASLGAMQAVFLLFLLAGGAPFLLGSSLCRGNWHKWLVFSFGWLMILVFLRGV